MIKSRLFALALLLAPAFAAASGGESAMESSQIDLGDKASLQRGASLYMSYCSGCHALGFHRYSRTAEDLGLERSHLYKKMKALGIRRGGEQEED